MTEPNDKPGKPDTSGFHLAHARATGDKPYLGDPATVEKLLREFLGDVMANHEAADEKCRALALIFAGKDESYTGVGHWNGEGLANTAREYGLEGDSAEDVIAEALGVLVGHVFTAAAHYGEEGTAALGTAINHYVASFRDLLVGMPSDALDAGDTGDDEEETR